MARYSPYKVYLDPHPDPPLVVPMPECEHAATHTPCPAGYLEWGEWADEMSKTHKQRRCEGCGRFHIWVPRARPGGRR